MDRPRLPDFIIGGAMKSGTTSLHRTLAVRPDVFIPDSELYFFDVDDVEQNPDFLPVGRAAGGELPDLDDHCDRYLPWYEAQFAGARPGQLVGEDSTTYLASRIAPERVHRIVPAVRLVFLLRDPVERAYSHYWHLVRTGRAVFPFEDTLRFAPENIVQRGCYRRQLERWLEHFERSRMCVLLFEDFVADRSSALRQVCEFLGLPELEAPEGGAAHENRGGVIVAPAVNRAFNQLVGHRTGRFGHDLTRPGGAASAGSSAPRSRRAAATRKVVRWAAGRLSRPYPPMGDDTRAVLEEVYRRENRGLEDLIGSDPARHWPWAAS